MEEAATFKAVKRGKQRTKKSVVAPNARPGRVGCAFAETGVSAVRAQVLRIGYCFLNLESRASQPGGIDSLAGPISNVEKKPMARAPPRWTSQRRFRKRYLALSVFPDYQPCKIFCQLSCMPIFVQLVPRDPSITHVEFVIVAALAY